MSKNYKTTKPIKHQMSKVEFSPIRSMDKFVSDFSQFRLPSLQTPDKWMNRVVSNLLYFQTNYFILTIVLFVIIRSINLF